MKNQLQEADEELEQSVLLESHAKRSSILTYITTIICIIILNYLRVPFPQITKLITGYPFLC